MWGVVVNDEEQFSIWAKDRDLPSGWSWIGVYGTEEECLSHIENTWTDIRPLSVRRAIAAGQALTPESGCSVENKP